MKKESGMMNVTHSRIFAPGLLLILCSLVLANTSFSAESQQQKTFKKFCDSGIRVVLGLPDGENANYVTNLAKKTKDIIFFQSPDVTQVLVVRQAAEKAGLLGKGVNVELGGWSRIALADNMAASIMVSAQAEKNITKEELLRVLHPEGRAVIGGKEIVKPLPTGLDYQTHPYGGPDNNPYSPNTKTRGPYHTRFINDPLFAPLPQASVSAGGRLFRAYGNISFYGSQVPWLNSVVCINAWNGTILWQYPLREGFMIHRNSMIATEDTLYLADDESCKLIDARSGKLKDQIVIPADISDGPVWKWVVLVDGVLYALIGGHEFKDVTHVDARKTPVPGCSGGWNASYDPVSKVVGDGIRFPKGHPRRKHWPGFDYKDPKIAFGYGRTFVAVDLATKKILWHHREEDYIDSRGVCMAGGRIFMFSPGRFVACLNAGDGKLAWKKTGKETLDVIGELGNQWGGTGNATTYAKCNDKYVIYGASDHLRNVSVLRAKDGSLVWKRVKKKHENYFKLLLRPNRLYFMPKKGKSLILDYETGKELGSFPAKESCPRVTGSADSLFYSRHPSSTVRFDLDTSKEELISMMRPPCDDGVLISNGLLYWGPWSCGCAYTLWGHICIEPRVNAPSPPLDEKSRLQVFAKDTSEVQPLIAQSGDWPCYRGNNAGTSVAGKSDYFANAAQFEVDVSSRTGCSFVDGSGYRRRTCFYRQSIWLIMRR